MHVTTQRLRQLPRPFCSKQTRPGSSVSNRRTANASSGNRNQLQLELWQALVLAGSSQLVNAIESATQAAVKGATRLQALVEPPPPGFPPGPLGDQAVALIGSPLDTLQQLTREHGKVVGLLLGGERVVLVSDPAAARQVLVDQADVFIKEGTAFFPGSSLAGNGLLVSDGEVWRRQRRLANSAFRRSAVEAYAEAMCSATTDMVTARWQPGEVRDVYADFNELTLTITLGALFNFSDTSGAQAREIVSAVETAFEYFTRRGGSALLVPEWIPTWDNLEFGAAVARLNRLVYGMISQRREQLAAGGQYQDLMTALLAARDADGSGMDDRSVRDELMTLLVAGQETSAILLAWSCALLAVNSEVQARAAAEVEQKLQGRAPVAADSRGLPYVEAVVLEALRLYSPAYMVGRCACTDAELNGYQLAAGTTVLVSPYLMHRDPELWEDAEVFRPERWLACEGGYVEALKDMGPNGGYVPFGGGPRNCIGTGFAMMEAVLVLAAVLQRWELRVPGGSTAGGMPVPKPMITLRPEKADLMLVPRGGKVGGVSGQAVGSEVVAPAVQ